MKCASHRATLVDIHQSQLELVVRAATFVVSIIAVGAYLAVAAAFAFSPMWIGLGVLAISLLAAVTMVVTDGATGSSRIPAS